MTSVDLAAIFRMKQSHKRPFAVDSIEDRESKRPKTQNGSNAGDSIPHAHLTNMSDEDNSECGSFSSSFQSAAEDEPQNEIAEGEDGSAPGRTEPIVLPSRPHIQKHNEHGVDTETFYDMSGTMTDMFEIANKIAEDRTEMKPYTRPEDQREEDLVKEAEAAWIASGSKECGICKVLPHGSSRESILMAQIIEMDRRTRFTMNPSMRRETTVNAYNTEIYDKAAEVARKKQIECIVPKWTTQMLLHHEIHCNQDDVTLRFVPRLKVIEDTMDHLRNHAIFEMKVIGDTAMGDVTINKAALDLYLRAFKALGEGYSKFQALSSFGTQGTTNGTVPKNTQKQIGHQPVANEKVRTSDTFHGF